MPVSIGPPREVQVRGGDRRSTGAKQGAGQTRVQLAYVPRPVVGRQRLPRPRRQRGRRVTRLSAQSRPECRDE